MPVVVAPQSARWLLGEAAAGSPLAPPSIRRTGPSCGPPTTSKLVNGEIERRTTKVGTPSNDASILPLTSAVLVETHDEWSVAGRRYLSEESMALVNAITDELDGEEAPLTITA